MKTFGPLKVALCIYDALRLAFLTGAFMLLQPEGEISFPWLAALTPGAMFFLMALFWLFNIPGYRVFSPLYLAGKGFGIATTTLWLFFAKGDTIRELLTGSAALFIAPGILVFFLLGDLFSVWIVVKIFNIGERESTENKIV